MTESDTTVYRTIVGAVFSIVVISGFVGIAVFTSPQSEEIGPSGYQHLQKTISTNCSQMKPIVALWIEEYKGITRGKSASFLKECEKVQSMELKRQIVEDFSK